MLLGLSPVCVFLDTDKHFIVQVNPVAFGYGNQNVSWGKVPMEEPNLLFPNSVSLQAPKNVYHYVAKIGWL